MKKPAYLFIALFSLGLTILAKYSAYFPFDLQITDAVQQFNPGWFDTLMNFFTFLGNLPMEIILILSASAFFYFKGFQREGIFILISTIGIQMLGEIIKIIVSRPRPNPLLIHQSGVLLGDSFPSSHVLFFIGFFGFLLFFIERIAPKNISRIPFNILFFALVLLIGLSRIYLGAHWFSDVLGAYAIGFLYLHLVDHIYHAK